jgi:hypothetical protein
MESIYVRAYLLRGNTLLGSGFMRLLLAILVQPWTDLYAPWLVTPTSIAKNSLPPPIPVTAGEFGGGQAGAIFRRKRFKPLKQPVFPVAP